MRSELPQHEHVDTKVRERNMTEGRRQQRVEPFAIDHSVVRTGKVSPHELVQSRVPERHAPQSKDQRISCNQRCDCLLVRVFKPLQSTTNHTSISGHYLDVFNSPRNSVPAHRIVVHSHGKTRRLRLHTNS